MTLLKLSDKYSTERLEATCEKALSYTPRPSLKSIQAILQSGRDKQNDKAEVTSSEADKYAIVRGAEYYRSKRRDD